MNTLASLDRKPLILLGAGGHAKVLLSLINALNWPVLGVSAPELTAQSVTSWRNIPVLDDDGSLNTFDPEAVHLVNCVGQRVYHQGRQHIFEAFKSRSFYFPHLIHPQACVDPTAYLSEGVQVMAGAVIQADARIGDNCIINTGARVDHDCTVADNVHIAPGAVLCGTVTVGQGSFIAAGATVIQGVTIGSNVIIGAGVSIVRTIADGMVVLPAPVRQQALSLA